MAKSKSPNIKDDKTFIFFEQHVPKTKENIVLDWLFFGLFILSFILVVFAINIYRHTVINPTDLIGIVSIGFIVTFLSFWIFLGKKLSLISLLFTGVVAGGGLFYFSFLFINKTFPKSITESITYPIRDTGELAKGKRSKCNTPYIVIFIHGIEKQLMFPCELRDTAPNSEVVVLEYFEGFLGYSYITKKELRRSESR
jgi:hypothetical protein